MESKLNKLKYYKDNLKAFEIDHKYHKLIIKNAVKKLMQTICECIWNILNGYLPIKDSDKVKLKKYKY